MEMGAVLGVGNILVTPYQVCAKAGLCLLHFTINPCAKFRDLLRGFWCFVYVDGGCRALVGEQDVALPAMATTAMIP